MSHPGAAEYQNLNVRICWFCTFPVLCDYNAVPYLFLEGSEKQRLCLLRELAMDVINEALMSQMVMSEPRWPSLRTE
jgi:hypothetical protein